MPNEIELNVSGGGGEVELQLQGGASGAITLEGSQSGGGQDGPYVRKAEAWAVGTKNGVAVPSTDQTYHNNSKYWSEQSQMYAGASAGFAVTTGVISSFPKVIQDSRIGTNTVVENHYVYPDMDLGWVTAAGELRLYGTLATGQTKPSVQLWLRNIDGLTQDAYLLTLRLVTTSGTNGNYLVAESRNLLPGVQYNYSLYKVVSGAGQYVYGLGQNLGWPTYSWWINEVARSLENGASYYVVMKKAGENTVLATSNTVQFVGG